MQGWDILWLEPTTPAPEIQEGKTVLEFAVWALWLWRLLCAQNNKEQREQKK